MQQINMFEMMKPHFKFTKPIRLIELFGGIGSQAKALTNLKCDYTHYKLVEFDKHCINSYNAIHNTKCNTNDITMVSGQDLEIVETKKYDYVMTYSFPCQDLSLAGKQAGMKKGSGTRSGLLWEVERILHELKELPQVLLMENVPDVIGTKNIEDFNEWQGFLASLGYSNYVEILNGKDFTIPQNRKRAFLVSILGDYSYTFPKKKPLRKRLKDMLETNVDEKYYLSDKQIAQIQNWNAQRKPLDETKTIDDELSSTITAKSNTSMNSSMLLLKEKLCDDLIKNNVVKEGMVINHSYTSSTTRKELEDYIETDDDIAPVLTTRPDVLGVCVRMPEATKKGYADAYEGDAVYLNRPHQKRGVVQRAMIQTIKTSNDDLDVIVRGNYMPSGHSVGNIYDTDGLAPTVMENHGTITAVIDTENYIYNKELGSIDNSRRAWKENKIMGTLTKTSDNAKVLQNDLRIRKLTPKECWSLMGFTDTDFDKASKVNSNAQLYKQAGNSIVVQVLEAIFKQML